jgi:hypothetical protein
MGVDELPAVTAQRIFGLIAQADFFRLPEDMGAAGSLDEQVFILTIEYGNGRTHTVRAPDSSVPPSLRPFIEELSSIADAQSA